MPLIHGVLYSGTTAYIGPVSTVTTNLTASKTAPGGDEAARWQAEVLYPEYLDFLDTLRPGIRIELHDDEGMYWRGRLHGWNARLNGRLGAFTFNALGYSSALQDRVYDTARTFASGRGTDRVIRDVLEDGMVPEIDTAGSVPLIRSVGRALSSASESYLGATPMDIISDMVKLGDQNANEVLWLVGAGAPGPANSPRLEVKVRPETTKYHTALSVGAEVILEQDLTLLANRILVLYGIGGNTSVAVEDVASQDDPPVGYGLRRDRKVNAPRLTSVADATKLANRLLNKYKRIPVHSSEIVLKGDVPLTDETGQRIWPWRADPSERIGVTDLQLGVQQPIGVDYPIARIEWSDQFNVGKITPAGREDITTVLARLIAQERGVP